MPDQEVLINDSNLNAIANAIRRKNGLVRTYKPREMAPAIRAINADAPDSREYTVTVIQTPHQTIKVRQVLGGEKQYDQSFTVSEPYWKIQATIEADAGYVAGGLNYQNEVIVDRDITIKATPATEATEPQETIITRYMNGARVDGIQRAIAIYQDYDCTQLCGWSGYEPPVPNYRPFNITYNFIDLTPSDRVPYYWSGISANSKNFGNNFGTRHCPDATTITQNFNTHGAINMTEMITTSPWLEYVDFSNFDMSTVETINTFISGCTYLKTVGDLSHWNTQSLRSISYFVQSSRYLKSLDLSGWNTPELRTVSNLFYGDNARILDISNWNTSLISSFGIPNSIQYIIMDKEEVKFTGEKFNDNVDGGYKFGRVNGRKYLVPESMVNDYKQHPNWSHIADQIDSVTNYTINRGDGQIEVVPNW